MLHFPLDLRNIKAIVFDLDNTLVSSSMDFRQLREQIGCPIEADLLSFINELECPKTAQLASEMVLNHELNDAQTSHPMPGCLSLLSFIESKQFLTAIITRNCERATLQKLSHNNLSISRVITREHFPPKPAPDALISLANEWNLKRHQVLYVGDYLYDLQAAYNADMPSCLVTHGKETPFAPHASLVVEQLSDLESTLSQHQ